MMEHLPEMADKVRSAVAAIPLPERGRTVAMGADGTPTSFIDRVAEDAILDYVKAEGLELNILSEEAGLIDSGHARTLVIDPVDGTFNACAGIPFYSVSLAVGSGALSGMEEALVMDLVTGDVYTASRGRGAFLNGHPIRTREPGGDMLLMAYMGSSALPRTYRVANRFRRVRSLGCVSLEICAVACGRADAFLIDYSDESKSPRVIDIAAATLVLREAGGRAVDGNGDILDMPLSLDVRRNMAALGSAETWGMMT